LKENAPTAEKRIKCEAEKTRLSATAGNTAPYAGLKWRLTRLTLRLKPTP